MNQGFHALRELRLCSLLHRPIQNADTAATSLLIVPLQVASAGAECCVPHRAKWGCLPAELLVLVIAEAVFVGFACGL